MEVKLLSKTDNSLKVAFTAIRRCYSSSSTDDIWNKEFSEYEGKNQDHIRLIKQIVNHGHTSTLEHIYFVFSVSNVSRACLSQHTRHRHVSNSVQSQRYVSLGRNDKSGGFEYYTPPAIESNKNAKEVYDSTMNYIAESYESLRSIGIKAEDARGVLSNATNTSMVVSMSLRSLIEYWNKRNSSTKSQQEIKELAEKMVEVVCEEEVWIKEIFDLNN